MSDKTNIAWTDSTHNFWRGCTKISPGCQHCYAETLVTTRLQGEWGKGKPRVRLKDFNKPLSWNRKPWLCPVCNHAMTEDESKGYSGCPTGFHFTQHHRRRVFSLSLGDIGDPEVSIELFNEAMVIVDKCRNLTWQLLTKRPVDFLERWNKVCNHWGRTDNSLPDNVWMGVSVENQARADELIPQLLNIPAKIRFLSVEPMLEAINLRKHFAHSIFCNRLPGPGMNGGEPCKCNFVNWAIFGGESGPGARLCNIEWIRDGVRQCKGAGVAVFVKQLGSRPVKDIKDSRGRYLGFEGVSLKDKKGGDISEWPIDLRVREFPEGCEYFLP